MSLFLHLCFFCSINTFIQYLFDINIRWGPYPCLHSCRLSGTWKEPPWGDEPRMLWNRILVVKLSKSLNFPGSTRPWCARNYKRVYVTCHNFHLNCKKIKMNSQKTGFALFRDSSLQNWNCSSCKFSLWDLWMMKADFVSECFASVLSYCLLRLQIWRHSFHINSFRKRKSGRLAQASQWSQWQVRIGHFWFYYILFFAVLLSNFGLA